MHYKLLLLSTVLLAFVISASGSDKSVGVKAGFGLSGFSGKNARELNPNYSYSFNAFYSQNVTPLFVIQPELLLIRKGCSLRGIHGGTYLSYLEFPVLFKGTFPSNKSFKPFLYAGPSFGILLSAKSEVSFLIEDTRDVKDDMNTFDFGIALGIGTGITTGPGNIIFDLRYESGLLDNTKEKNGIQPEMKNYNFELFAGYAIQF